MRMLLPALLLGLIAQAWGGNAAWYRWEGQVAGGFICAQTSPGEGWKKVAGPYSDAACSKPR